MCYSVHRLQRMATSNGTSEDDDAELKDLENEISELRSAKKELFEKARPINEELERIALRERECVDKQHRLIAEKHDRERQKLAARRLVELESENKRLTRENETLKRDDVANSNTNQKLKRSLDQATKRSRVQAQRIAELEQLSAELQLRLQNVPAVSETAASSAVQDLQKQLHRTLTLLTKTTENLTEMRQRLSDVQERLTLAEQVTAATQQRELQESDNSEQELTPQHQPTASSGDVFFINRTFRWVNNYISMATAFKSLPKYALFKLVFDKILTIN